MVWTITVSLSAAGLLRAAEESGFSDKLIQPDNTVEKQPLVQMAILLDTSGSMSGLIDQARTELWAIVNEFMFASKDGRTPELQVALYEYGKSSLSAEQGYIREILPLTTDLDKVSEELFALNTNGGEEYCGWVIKEATRSLKWSDSPDDLKVIFIAGNEPFTQGPVDYRQACKAAISKNIVVNTIHCRDEARGIEGMWKDGALLADGEFINIDHNRRVVHVEAPQDDEITRLSAMLNTTYLAYGQNGRVACERQTQQDMNAATVSKSAEVGRAVTKASVNYNNSTWDLVDAVTREKLNLDELNEEDLPEEMRELDAEERLAYITAKAKQRAEISKKIQQLNQQRKEYVAEQMKKLQPGGDTLGSAVIKAIRGQAGRRNFEFKPPKPAEKDGEQQN